MIAAITNIARNAHALLVATWRDAQPLRSYRVHLDVWTGYSRSTFSTTVDARDERHAVELAKQHAVRSRAVVHGVVSVDELSGWARYV